MKKVLFATTALVASAGVAAADDNLNINITGGAEMGISNDGDDTVFFQSVDIRFAMTGVADNGLDFGATVDINDMTEQGDSVDIAGDFADFTVFISGNFGTLTMGDTDGALDFVTTEVGNVGNPGSIADDETGHAGYYGGNFADGTFDLDGQVLRYNYSFSDFTVALSAEVDDAPDDATSIQIGAKYDFDFGGGNGGIGLGYGEVDDTDIAAAGLDLDFDVIQLSAFIELDSGFSAGVEFTDIDGSDDATGSDGEHYGISLSYETGPFAIHANYGEFDWDTTAIVEDSEGFGIAAAYDFGGGLSAHLAYGESDYGDLNAAAAATADSETWSLGFAMSF